MRLGIYVNGEIPTKGLLINRNKYNWYSIPFYLFMILFSNKSAGDNKYGTVVDDNRVNIQNRK